MTLRIFAQTLALFSILSVPLGALPCANNASAQAVELQAQPQRSITFAEAERIALREFPNGRIKSIERDTWRGRAVFEIDVIDVNGVEYELTLNAETGAVLRRQVDDD